MDSIKNCIEKIYSDYPAFSCRNCMVSSCKECPLYSCGNCQTHSCKDCPLYSCKDCQADSCGNCQEHFCKVFRGQSCQTCGLGHHPGCGGTCNGYLFEQSVCEVIESIALMETAMAHILNAEGEKIQKAVTLSCNVGELLEVNYSVNKLITYATQLEQNYYQKLDAVNELYKMRAEQSQNNCPPPSCTAPEPGSPCEPVNPCFMSKPCKPCNPCNPCNPRPCPPDCAYAVREHRPSPPDYVGPVAGSSMGVSYEEEGVCQEQQPFMSAFSAVKEYPWISGTALKLRMDSGYGNRITLRNGKIDSTILLPAGKKFRIEYELTLINKYSKTVIVNMRLCQGNQILQTKALFGGTYQSNLTNRDSFIFETPASHETCALSIWLLSGNNLQVVSGRIIVTEIQNGR